MRIRVAIFDDNKNIRNSIILMLNTDPELEVVGIYPDARNCVDKLLLSKPDVVLMDIEMPGMNGIEAVRLIKAQMPAVAVIIQTVFEDEEKIFDSLKAGASGYILKNALKNVTLAIKETHSGGSPMTPWVARKVLNMIYHSKEIRAQSTEEYNLSNKEKEVLLLIVNGLSYKMIAAQLNISYETVRGHVKKIYDKLHVASLTEVVAKAIKQRIV
ncbi:response regulator transcription factor [Mucilaginibacter terrae]|uniref:DNA-binding NarL/FixJ family response regulator n=1 Tax=Mucilaginibacter terrae TaxID=1955052 RepID=A0ABU3GRC5_9SPHI|nr:response regulator transcription factor [Mucilaginibacter terrae]MDT3402338.1 DNA-binding NarL/FixJ family response regulator [Mucilaginibacter terrae]